MQAGVHVKRLIGASAPVRSEWKRRTRLAFASGVDNPYAAPVSQMNKTGQQKQETCRIYGVPWVEAPQYVKVGLAGNVHTGLQPRPP